MFFTKEESFILDDMEKAFKRHKKFNYQLYYDCKECCDIYGIEQLHHAKAILEKKLNETNFRVNFITFVIAIVTVIFTCLGICVSMVSLEETMINIDSSCSYEMVMEKQKDTEKYNIIVNDKKDNSKIKEKSDFLKDCISLGKLSMTLSTLLLTTIIYMPMYYAMAYVQKKNSYFYSIVCDKLNSIDDRKI